MVFIINKWVFPIFSVVFLSAFFIYDNKSISPAGAILAMLLTFIGMAVTERLDTMIKGKNFNHVPDFKIEN